MTLKNYVILATIAFLLVAGWLWLGPVAVVVVVSAGFFFYLFLRLFSAVVNRLER